MEKRDIISLLYTIYSAGFVHGINEGAFPKHDIFEAFNRLLIFWKTYKIYNYDGTRFIFTTIHKYINIC
jgi:hypothetical protein